MQNLLISLSILITALAPLSTNFSYVNDHIQTGNNQQSHARERNETPCSDHCLKTVNQHKDEFFLSTMEVFHKIIRQASLFFFQFLSILISAISLIFLSKNKFALNPHLSLIQPIVLIR